MRAKSTQKKRTGMTPGKEGAPPTETQLSSAQETDGVNELDRQEDGDEKRKSRLCSGNALDWERYQR